MTILIFVLPKKSCHSSGRDIQVMFENEWTNFIAEKWKICYTTYVPPFIYVSVMFVYVEFQEYKLYVFKNY
jgi:hypothetical protein